MIVLGIHYGHDANAAIIKDGKILFAISEERLNRVKFYRGFPFLSIKAALKNTGLNMDSFDQIALVNCIAQDEALGGNLINFYQSINKTAPFYIKIISSIVSICDNICGTKIRKRIAKKLVLK